MSRELVLGSASIPTGELEQPDSGVRFRIPYEETGFDITLSNEDMNQLLKIGLQRVIINEPVGHPRYEAEVDLPNDNLGIYLGLKGIGTSGHDGWRQDVTMDIVAVTKSIVHEHQGILNSERPSFNGLWRYLAYTALPPLRDPKAV